MNIKFHDPLIIGEAGKFYCFSTDTHLNGVQISKSDDLINWELYKTALSKTPLPVINHVGNRNFWAPELIKAGDNFRLYFCSSMFGKSQSIIGMAESSTIDGDYKFKGDVVKSYHTGLYNAPNAIDPNVITDENGKAYMAYGSFFGGIYIAPLNKKGFFAKPGYGKCIAGGNHTPLEGPYIIYNKSNGYYYMFLSYGSLRYDYHIRVARSKNITGPYVDSNGHKMTDLDPILRTGDKIAGGYNFDLPGFTGYMAPGHNSVFAHNGKLYVVHHIRPEGQEQNPLMQLREIFFNDDGQLYISPAPYEKEMPHNANKNDINAFTHASIVRLDSFSDGVSYGRKLPFASLNYILSENGRFEIKLYNKTYVGKAFMQGEKLYFSVISKCGECLWGTAF